MYPGLHLSSSKENSQGQASGWSLNRGISIIPPASAQLTLTPAKSQEKAAKAERFLFESTGKKICLKPFTREAYINFFCLF